MAAVRGRTARLLPFRDAAPLIMHALRPIRNHDGTPEEDNDEDCRSMDTRVKHDD